MKARFNEARETKANLNPLGITAEEFHVKALTAQIVAESFNEFSNFLDGSEDNYNELNEDQDIE